MVSLNNLVRNPGLEILSVDSYHHLSSCKGRHGSLQHNPSSTGFNLGASCQKYFTKSRNRPCCFLIAAQVPRRHHVNWRQGLMRATSRLSSRLGYQLSDRLNIYRSADSRCSHSAPYSSVICSSSKVGRCDLWQSPNAIFIQR